MRTNNYFRNSDDSVKTINNSIGVYGISDAVQPFRSGKQFLDTRGWFLVRGKEKTRDNW